jgi:hypothetical protein
MDNFIVFSKADQLNRISHKRKEIVALNPATCLASIHKVSVRERERESSQDIKGYNVQITL